MNGASGETLFTFLSSCQSCYEAGIVNGKKACHHAPDDVRLTVFVWREAPYLLFPPNACRGERRGVWGRVAPINPVRAASALTRVRRGRSPPELEDLPRSNLLSKRSIYAERDMMTFAE
jgi:hypothetical protein